MLGNIVPDTPAINFVASRVVSARNDQAWSCIAIYDPLTPLRRQAPNSSHNSKYSVIVRLHDPQLCIRNDRKQAQVNGLRIQNYQKYGIYPP
jgi:hypothetical protein